VAAFEAIIDLKSTQTTGTFCLAFGSRNPASDRFNYADPPHDAVTAFNSATAVVRTFSQCSLQGPDHLTGPFIVDRASGKPALLLLIEDGVRAAGDTLVLKGVRAGGGPFILADYGEIRVWRRHGQWRSRFDVTGSS
jgi:hypothetical protein